MSQDKELDAIANIIRDQLEPLPYKNMFPEKQEQVREIQQLIATLIREARIETLDIEEPKIFMAGFYAGLDSLKDTPVNAWEEYKKSILNQQKGDKRL